MGWTASANLILEQPLRSSAPLEWAYSSGVGKMISDRFELGIEAFGNFHEERHFIGATAGVFLKENAKLLATAAIAHQGGGKAGRLLLEVEW